MVSPPARSLCCFSASLSSSFIAHFSSASDGDSSSAARAARSICFGNKSGERWIRFVSIEFIQMNHKIASFRPLRRHADHLQPRVTHNTAAYRLRTLPRMLTKAKLCAFAGPNEPSLEIICGINRFIRVERANKRRCTARVDKTKERAKCNVRKKSSCWISNVLP